MPWSDSGGSKPIKKYNILGLYDYSAPNGAILIPVNFKYKLNETTTNLYIIICMFSRWCSGYKRTSQACGLDIPVILTPHSGHIDPPGVLVSKNEVGLINTNCTILIYPAHNVHHQHNTLS